MGGLLGFTVDRLIMQDRIGDNLDQRGLRTRLAQDLSLTEPQRTAVDSILDVRNRRIDEIVAPVRPQMDSIMDVARDEIRAILTADQRTKFEVKVRASDERSKD